MKRKNMNFADRIMYTIGYMHGYAKRVINNVAYTMGYICGYVHGTIDKIRKRHS